MLTRRYLPRLTLGIFGIMAVAATVSAQGKDPLQGTWKQNMTKSTCAAVAGSMCPPAPKLPTTRTYDDLGNGWVYVTNDGISAMGMPTGNRIVARRDGRDYPIAGRGQTGYVMLAFNVKSTRPYSADYTTKLDGKLTATATETLSADGRTLTITVKNVNPQDGMPTTNVVQVWDKQ